MAHCARQSSRKRTQANERANGQTDKTYSVSLCVRCKLANAAAAVAAAANAARAARHITVGQQHHSTIAIALARRLPPLRLHRPAPSPLMTPLTVPPPTPTPTPMSECVLWRGMQAAFYCIGLGLIPNRRRGVSVSRCERQRAAIPASFGTRAEAIPEADFDDSSKQAGRQAGISL